MQMYFYLVLISTALAQAAATQCPTASISAKSNWKLQRDNLSEYRLISSKVGISSSIECQLLAGKFAANSTLHAAAFNAAGGNCTLFQCLLGDGGCRKCRNANNPTLPLIWVRSLGSRNNCWTTFQRRVDASLSFNRNWTDYAAGFGQGEDRNYWMGLDKLSLMSGNDNCGVGGVRCRVRWEFSDWNGKWYWAENANFTVASASDKYRLKMGALDTARSSVGQTPLNLRWSPNNRRFSTFDSDNDAANLDNCAGDLQAGWWFGWCTAINANGVYNSPSLSSGVYYFYDGSPYPLDLDYSMKTFEIMMFVAN